MHTFLGSILNRGSVLLNTTCHNKHNHWRNVSVRLFASDIIQRERTFIMVKPDAVNRGFIGEIIKRFEQKGYKLVAMKLIIAPESLLREHYKNLTHKPFYGKLMEYMSMGPVVPMIWEGDNVVSTARIMLGETDPNLSRPGTIRGDFGIFTGRNVCHGSDSVSAAEREMNLWFKPEEIFQWQSCHDEIIYED